jgi:hypothetical protein
MRTPWKDLLRLLARQVPSTVAYWYMKNGAEFYLAIPEEQDILDDTLSPTIEFPFTFEEIEVLRIPRRIRKSSITNDIEVIAALLQSMGEIHWRATSDELEIGEQTK